MDEYFEEFLIDEGFGPASESVKVNDATIKKYRNKLPNRLLDYWQEHGFCSYGEGLFWTVNPQDYEDIVTQWLSKTPLRDRENYYVIARTAFGQLYVWGDKSHSDTIIDPHYCTILSSDIPNKKLTDEDKDRYLGIFFGTQDKVSQDFRDSNDKKLFKKAIKKLGHLEHDEMFTFSPALAAGGVADIKNLKKAKIIEQLAILSELDTPMILKSAEEAFGPL